MPKFSYIASDQQGKSTEGSLEADSRENVIAVLRSRNLTPITIKEGDLKKKATVGFSLNLFSSTKVKSDDLVLFTRQLSAMVSAGVPIIRALSSQRDHTDSKGLAKILASSINDIEAGAPLADALGKFPDTFNDVYVNMVRSGEAAGILDDVLKRLALQQEKNMTMRKKIKGAMTYPIVLLCITVLAFFGLMIFVIPRIGDIVKDLGGANAELPGITQFMLSTSDFVISKGWILIPSVVIVIFLIVRWTKTTAGKKVYHGLLLKLPVVKTLVQKVSVARFSRTFSSLMGAGVAVLEALDVTARAIGNTIYEEALINAAEQVKNGRSLSSVISEQAIFPPILAQMLAVGEETGQTDQVIIKIADFYEEEVDMAIDSVSSIIEPVMIVIMGSMVGLIAASVMVPIAGLSQSINP